MLEAVIRFLVGGVVVSAFALWADILKPKSFAGLFGAAPSLALATIGLTLATRSKAYVAIEARSMISGAIAVLIYAAVVSKLLLAGKWSARMVTGFALILWFVGALSFWYFALRRFS
jgi:hypothetical protein